MNPKDQNKLFDLIENTLGCNREDITPESDFLEDFNATPEETSELVGKIEEAFGIELDREEVKETSTVSQLMVLIEEAQLET